MSDGSERANHDEVNSRAPASEYGTSSNVPIPPALKQELKNMFFEYMNQWFSKFMQERNLAQQPPSPIVPPIVPPVAPPPPPVNESSKRTPIGKLRKYGAEEFRGRLEDDSVKAEYWLQNTIKVFEEMACSPNDYLRCAVFLLKEEAYNWWSTIVAVVPKEKISWEFFQTEFKKKYIGKRYLDKKKREFLELRQENRSVAEYGSEFLYLSKYAREIVPTEEEMCFRFKEGLNDEIQIMIGGNEIREFVVLLDHAQKMEELYNRKMQRDRQNRESYKRGSSKTFSASPAKKSKDDFSRATSMSEQSNKNKMIQPDYVVSTRPTSEARAPARTYAIQIREAQHLGKIEGVIRKDYSPLARMGATVTGIDAVEKNIKIARLHAA
ncbi:Hexaprenyldihydroxybenzoate methyltransferase, mitochondrial -like protein [Gossypium arboreum]|uniref:Hexaprenyldihydroxybenzoate methyltransferase, mitochondrial-like protein n=1 Tax=Gossypium arboreum TaxID=29729 RepID=A0A0B0NAW6_GOSAR|nr:Hexaprenyldihydroxybenzoate methyltransferase, mitochondrial -like protein [Gossypium arboreum]